MKVWGKEQKTNCLLLSAKEMKEANEQSDQRAKEAAMAESELLENERIAVEEDEEKYLIEEKEANEQADQRVKEADIAEAKRLEDARIAAEEARKPKMFEGILKPLDIIDAEVVRIC